MRRILKAMIILSAAGLLMMVGTGLALGATLMQSGLMTVKVNETVPGGNRIHVPVPAGLVHLGLNTALWLAPDEEVQQIRQELEPYREPLQAVANAIDDCPNVTLVEVHTDNERVMVTKSGGTLRVDVHSEDTDVVVTLPANTFRKLVRLIS